MWTAVLVATVASATTPDALRSTLAAFNTHAVYKLPVLSDDDLAKLAAGKVVKIREVGAAKDQPQRAVGLLLSSHDRAALWVAARTEDDNYDGMSHYQVPAVGAERWYQYLHVPFPFSDRHWVIDVWDNHALSADGPCWEHPWRLAPAGYEAARAAVAAGRVSRVTAKSFDSAVKVPVNNGAWVACTVGDQTLLGFHAQSVVGGSIPDRLVTDFTMLTLGKVLRGVDERARSAASWYTGGMVGGDGLPIELTP